MIPTDKHFTTAPPARHGTAWQREFGRDEPLADCLADASRIYFLLRPPERKLIAYYSIAPPSFCPSPLLPSRCYSCTSIRKVNSQNQMVVCTGGMQAVENGAICCDLSRALFLSPQPQLSIHSHSAALTPLLLFFFWIWILE